MSRVAKAPVMQPAHVEVRQEAGTITVKGPNGTLTQKINHLVKININNESKQIEFAPASNDPNAWAQAGTARALVSNMVQGVTEGFTLGLELVGVGYRAQASGRKITLSLGFSHPIEFTLPPEVSAETPSNTQIILKSANKQLLGEAAAQIRAYREPEPYKGKGVRYAGEEVVRKEAKKK